jgi:hypothetical protein
MIRKISGKGGGVSISHLKQNGQWITTPKAIADAIGTSIAKNSSSSNYSPSFQQIKRRR